MRVSCCPHNPCRSFRAVWRTLNERESSERGRRKRRERSQELRKENITKTTHLMTVQIFVCTVERGDGN